MTTRWWASFLTVLLLASASGTASALDDDPRCLIDPIRFGCDVGGGGPGEDDPWSESKEWSLWDDGGRCLRSGIAGRWIYRILLWATGPNAGAFVQQSDFGGILSNEVPFAPPRWDGSPATFGPDGLVRDTACATPGFEFAAEVWDLVPSGELATDPVVRGLVGLDTWLWWQGATTVGPITMTWSDPGLGAVLELEARAVADRFEWTVDTETVVTSHGGSGDDLPDSAAVTTMFEVPGTVDLAVEVQWSGEYRVRLAGDAWGPWLPIPGGAVRADSAGYPVIEVRSGLIAR